MPYTSTHATAEWIEETPLEIGTDAGFASLPNLSNPTFTNATVNGANANLQASEALDLVDSNNNVIGSVSGPNAATTDSTLAPGRPAARSTQLTGAHPEGPSVRP